MLQALGVSPPVLHPPASPTIIGVPTDGLTARRSLGTESRVGFLLPNAYDANARAGHHAFFPFRGLAVFPVNGLSSSVASDEA